MPMGLDTFANILAGAGGTAVANLSLRAYRALFARTSLFGRWIGELKYTGDGERFPTEYIKWDFVVVQQMTGLPSGMIYYTRGCWKRGPIAKGLDGLDSFEQYKGHRLPPRFTFVLTRHIHRPLRGPSDTSPRRYSIDCHFTAIVARHSLAVTTYIVNGENRDRWAGVLHKT